MHILKKISLRNKLIIVFSILAIGNLAICLYYFYNISNVVEVNQQSQEAYSEIWEISNALQKADIYMESYIETGDEEVFELYEENKAFVQSSLMSVELSTENIEEIFLQRAIINSTSAAFALYNQTIIDIGNDSPYYYLNYYEGTKIMEYAHGYFIEYTNLLLEDTTDKMEILKSDTQVAFVTIQTIIVMFAILYICLAFSFSSWITNPITKLVKAAKKISEGNYEFADVPVPSEVELGELTTTFNIMKSDISKAIEVLEERVEIEKQLRESELKELKNEELLREAKYLTLQSQMNPHFLFNTLNAISRSVEYAPKDVSIHLVHSLATICRYNLDHVNTYSTVEEELYITERYIYIQQHRFENRIQYFVECDPDCGQVLIPSLLLQPLVENALVHGIECKEDGGAIYVKINRKENGVCLRVFDNGVGIPKEKLAGIKMDISGCYSGHTTRIGLGNIIQRIELIEHSTIEMISREHRGTLIKMYMPYQ